MTTAEKKFKRAVRSLWAKGLYPSPRLLNEKVHGRRSSNLGGKEPQWRREVFRDLGIPLQRRRRGVFERILAPRRRLNVLEEDIDLSATSAFVGYALVGVDPADGRDSSDVVIHEGNVPIIFKLPPSLLLPKVEVHLPAGPRRIKA